jgi:hypothetical protein
MTASESPGKPSSHGLLGSLLLLGGIILLVMRGLQAMQTLSGLPRFWHNNDVLWWGLGLGLSAFGTWLLAQTSETKDRGGWRPAKSGRRFQNLILYTRVGCHLCDEAREILEQHAAWLPEIVDVDIDHDPRLRERYGACVPVVALDGKVRFRGRIAPELLRRLIEATPVSS